jgi:hypothetical protein
MLYPSQQHLTSPWAIAQLTVQPCLVCLLYSYGAYTGIVASVYMHFRPDLVSGMFPYEILQILPGVFFW